MNVADYCLYHPPSYQRLCWRTEYHSLASSWVGEVITKRRGSKSWVVDTTILYPNSDNRIFEGLDITPSNTVVSGE